MSGDEKRISRRNLIVHHDLSINDTSIRCSTTVLQRLHFILSAQITEVRDIAVKNISVLLRFFSSFGCEFIPLFYELTTHTLGRPASSTVKFHTIVHSSYVCLLVGYKNCILIF